MNTAERNFTDLKEKPSLNNWLDKVPPYSLEAEKAVLGSMLLDGQALESAVDLLDETSFYDRTHQQLFAVMKELSILGKAVDLVILSEELRKRQLFLAIGGAEFLAELVNTVSTAAHIE